jgi:hypothetical protein
MAKPKVSRWRVLEAARFMLDGGSPPSRNTSAREKRMAKAMARIYRMVKEHLDRQVDGPLVVFERNLVLKEATRILRDAQRKDPR